MSLEKSPTVTLLTPNFILHKHSIYLIDLIDDNMRSTIAVALAAPAVASFVETKTSSSPLITSPPETSYVGGVLR